MVTVVQRPTQRAHCRTVHERLLMSCFSVRLHQMLPFGAVGMDYMIKKKKNSPAETCDRLTVKGITERHTTGKSGWEKQRACWVFASTRLVRFWLDFFLKKSHKVVFTSPSSSLLNYVRCWRPVLAFDDQIKRWGILAWHRPKASRCVFVPTIQTTSSSFVEK